MNNPPENVPSLPGVYLFKNAEGRILYIGKAKNLRLRIAHYFQRHEDPVLHNLLNKAHEVDTIITDNERDALHLEYNLIQTHQPPFNIRLKDDKSYPSIEITTQHDFPGIFYSRRFQIGSTVFGPVSDAKKTKVLIDLITRIFQIRVCPDVTFNRGVACLYHYIDRCSAPCEGKIEKKEYHRRVEEAVDFMRGRHSQISGRLTKEMEALAKKMEYEQAQRVKEDLQLIHDFRLESYISSGRTAESDILGLYAEGNDNLVILFSVLAGRVSRRDLFTFSNLDVGPQETLREFLISHYTRGNIPGEILVPYLPTDHLQLQEMFSSTKGRRVFIRVPLRGQKRRILDLAIKNINEHVKNSSYDALATRLMDRLKLTHPPHHIEGFDVSHLSEFERVGAAVVFIDGKPKKSLYRNYLIKTAGAGDTEALKEIMERRFKKMSVYPDLLLIDGGKPQLSAAKQVKKKIHIASDIVSIAKREERIFLENGGSLLFSSDSPEKYLLQNIRDEAHRRAVSHHRKRREKLPY